SVDEGGRRRTTSSAAIAVEPRAANVAGSVARRAAFGVQSRILRRDSRRRRANENATFELRRRAMTHALMGGERRGLGCATRRVRSAITNPAKEFAATSRKRERGVRRGLDQPALT